MYTSATSGSSGSTGFGSTAAASGEMGKDAFLKLLITQLQNQDPLQPVDNQAFIAQLAQFSSVEQLQGLGSRLDTLLLAQASANQMNTTTLVGKDVAFKSDGVDLVAGQGAAMEAQLSAPGALKAVIQDASGRVVRTLDLGSCPAGATTITWDGLGPSGEVLPPGHYKVILSARSGDEKVGADLRIRGRVTGVTFDSSGALLQVGGSRVRLADIMEINQP